MTNLILFIIISFLFGKYMRKRWKESSCQRCSDLSFSQTAHKFQAVVFHLTIWHEGPDVQLSTGCRNPDKDLIHDDPSWKAWDVLILALSQKDERFTGLDSLRLSGCGSTLIWPVWTSLTAGIDQVILSCVHGQRAVASFSLTHVDTRRGNNRLDVCLRWVGGKQWPDGSDHRDIWLANLNSSANPSFLFWKGEWCHSPLECAAWLGSSL